MSRSISLSGVLFAVYVTVSGPALAMEEADHGAHAKSGGAHSHSEMVEMSAGDPAPAVSLQVFEDAVGGWNLKIDVERFRFTPNEVNEPHQPGHGHAHLYINGEKIARLYGPWHHLGHLPPGTNTVSITLNANDHRTYAVSGAPITADATIDVPN